MVVRVDVYRNEAEVEDNGAKVIDRCWRCKMSESESTPGFEGRVENGGLVK